MLTHIAYETEEDLVIAGMVAEGFGISILPNDHLIGTMNLEVLPLDNPDAGKTANLNFAFRRDTFSHNKNSPASIGISDRIQSCFHFSFMRCCFQRIFILADACACSGNSAVYNVAVNRQKFLPRSQAMIQMPQSNDVQHLIQFLRRPIFQTGVFQKLNSL